MTEQATLNENVSENENFDVKSGLSLVSHKLVASSGSSLPKLWIKKILPTKTPHFFLLRPGCSELTASLVNESLKFLTLISQMRQYFCRKNVESFSSIFLQKYQYVWL